MHFSTVVTILTSTCLNHFNVQLLHSLLLSAASLGIVQSTRRRGLKTMRFIGLAFGFSGGELSSLVLATLAAVAGGGVFGDHCSPLSDTSILASTGAASDHIDHVKTQLPYALALGGLSTIIYLVLGVVTLL